LSTEGGAVFTRGRAVCTELLKKTKICHSERSEESFFDLCIRLEEKQEEILRVSQNDKQGRLQQPAQLAGD